MSLYVIARVAAAWREGGTTAVRVGWREPVFRTEDWPELAGLTRREKRLVLARARARLPRPKILSRRLLVGFAASLAILLLEFFLYPPPDTDSNPRTVELARSELGVLLILPFMTMIDPRDQEGLLRSTLRENVLPEFWQQPWLWDRPRREAAGTLPPQPSP
jgi:hypothetical protein